MKSTVRNFITLLTGLLLSFYCNADNGVEHRSKVDGVSPFWLLLERSAVPNDLFTAGDEKKLVSYCNGKNKVFIYELGSKEFICKSRKQGKVIETDEQAYYIDILGFTNEDISSAPHLYQHSQGIYTVSRQLIPQQHWEVEPLPANIIAQLQKLSQGKYKCPEGKKDCLCPLLTGSRCKEQYDSKVAEIEYTYEKTRNRALRVKGSNVEVLLVPIGTVSDGVDATIISSVFAKSDASYQYVGHFAGYLIRVGADIDGDGLPELILDNSGGDSQEINYYKIYPVVEFLMSYDHS